MGMEDHRLEDSPQLLARIGGALYLVIIALGTFGSVSRTTSSLYPRRSSSVPGRRPIRQSGTGYWRCGRERP
jgi:hypothetical protein